MPRRQKEHFQMQQRLTRIIQNHFVRAVTILAGGTALGQAVALLVLPLLTRLYTPQDFSTLAVFVGLMQIVSVTACLRFDIAIPLPERNVDGANLLALALLLAALVSSLVALPVLLVPGQLANLLGQRDMQSYFWLLPIGVMLASSYSALQFWATRRKEFGLISRTRISQAIGGAGTQVVLGTLGFAPLGLILGQMISSGAGVLGLAFRAVKNIEPAWSALCFPEMRRLFADYQRFPKYSTLEAFANSAAIQVPVIIIAAAAIGPEAGYLALAMRAMQAPMGLIGGAVGQVYLSRAPGEYRAQNLGPFTASIQGGLLRAGIGPLLCAGLIASELFAMIFGQQWQRAGVLVAWMTPWFVFQFLSSPISMALHVTGNQKTALQLQLFGLALRVAFVLLAIGFAQTRVAEAYALSGAFFYLVYLVLVLRVVSCTRQDILNQLKNSLIYILPWCFGGLVFKYSFRAISNGLH